MRWVYGLVKGVGRPVGMRLGSFVQHAPREVRWEVVEAENRDGGDGEGGPRFGIVTPSFNQGRFVGGAIESVVGQGYEGVRYAVVDGGSTDGSVGEIEARAGGLFWWCSEPDGGQSQAINKGFARVLAGDPGRGGVGEPELGATDVMAWLNADDRLAPGALAAVARVFRDEPGVDVVYGHRIVVDEEGREVGRWVLPEHRARSTVWGSYVPQETLFWRRRAWEAAGGRVDEGLRFAMDWDLFVRLEAATLAAGRRVVRIPLFLGVFTTHGDQKSVAIKEGVGRREFAEVRRRYAGRGLARVACAGRTYGLLARSVPAWWAAAARRRGQRGR